jgi:hypothetical protein
LQGRCTLCPEREPGSSEPVPKRRIVALLAASTRLAPVAQSATIRPLDRPAILAGSPFDATGEGDGVVSSDHCMIPINGEIAAGVPGRDAASVEREPGVGASAIRSDAGIITAAGHTDGNALIGAIDDGRGQRDGSLADPVTFDSPKLGLPRVCPVTCVQSLPGVTKRSCS